MSNTKLTELKGAIETLEAAGDLGALKHAMELIGEDVAEAKAPGQVLGSKVKIVVLQRGWVVVGQYSHNATTATLENASVIRTWGTTKGIGQLALEGATSSTKLDPVGTINFERLTTVLVIDVKDDSLWLKKLS